MTDDELVSEFGEDGWNQLPDAISKKYHFVPAKVEIEEHHIGVYERSIRGFCIRKKNWQVLDTINGAKASAIIYSIAETAKANNLKPYDYFEYLLTELP